MDKPKSLISLHPISQPKMAPDNWGSSVALTFATQLCRRTVDDRRKPLARYSAIGSALRERLLRRCYTMPWDTTFGEDQHLESGFGCPKRYHDCSEGELTVIKPKRVVYANASAGMKGATATCPDGGRQSLSKQRHSMEGKPTVARDDD